jgi:hypothetical protein
MSSYITSRPTSWSRWWVLRKRKGSEDLSVVIFSDPAASKWNTTMEERNSVVLALSAGAGNDSVGLKRKAALAAAVFSQG